MILSRDMGLIVTLTPIGHLQKKKIYDVGHKSSSPTICGPRILLGSAVQAVNLPRSMVMKRLRVAQTTPSSDHIVISLIAAPHALKKINTFFSIR